MQRKFKAEAHRSVKGTVVNYAKDNIASPPPPILFNSLKWKKIPFESWYMVHKLQKIKNKSEKMIHLNFPNSMTSHNHFFSNSQTPFPSPWTGKGVITIKQSFSYTSEVLLHKESVQKHGVQRWLQKQHEWQMAATVSVMDPAWINYSPVVHTKRKGCVPASISHPLPSYSYMTHLPMWDFHTVCWY